MKYSTNGRARFILLAFFALAGCGTTTPERQTAAQSDLPIVSAPSPASAPLDERLSSALRSADPEESDTVKVTSIDGIVLLTGQVLSEQAKSQATNTAAFIGGGEVLSLTNELRVVDAIDSSDAEQDELLTSSVESLLATNRPAPATPLKAVVENGRVYLLGRISREQGNAAIELLGRLEGVEATPRTAPFRSRAHRRPTRRRISLVGWQQVGGAHPAVDKYAPYLGFQLDDHQQARRCLHDFDRIGHQRRHDARHAAADTGRAGFGRCVWPQRV